MTPRLTAALLGLAAIAGGAVQAQAPAPRQDSTPRQGPTAPALNEGKQVYARWCAPCHAADPGLAGTLALRTRYGSDRPAALEDRTDLTPEVVAYFVRNGIAWMPPFRPTEISEAELAALGRYLAAPLPQRGAHAELLADEMLRQQESRR